MSAARAYFAVIMFVGAAASIPFVVTAATSVIASVAPLKHVRTCALPILIVALPHSRQGQGNFY